MAIYLDHNAATPLRPEVRAAWIEAWEEAWANPSSLHGPGRRARHRIDEARERIAAALAVPEDTILFTSGGTEATNLGLRGSLRALGKDGVRHPGLAVGASEHSAVLETATDLARAGHALALVGVDREGYPRTESLAEALSNPDCRLVSLAAANGEMGAAPDLCELVQLVRAAPGPRRLFHTDAVQALGRLPVDLVGWDVDLASFSAHKLGGPRGVGWLYVRPGTALEPLLTGGGHERGLRAGTEDAPAIAAAAVAVELAVAQREAFADRSRALLVELWQALAESLPGVRLVGPALEAVQRLPNTLCLALPDREGKVLVTALDLLGLEVSSGSACASGSVEPSHVLLAMGWDEATARGGLRLSLGWNTRVEDIRTAVEILLAGTTPSRASRGGTGPL